MSDVLYSAKSKSNFSSEPNSNSFLDDTSNVDLEKIIPLIRNYNWTDTECDAVFDQLKSEIPTESPLVLNLFEPVDFKEEVHPCLEKLVVKHQLLSNNKIILPKLRRSLNWVSNSVALNELLIYLWIRRSVWRSFKPSYWEDITPHEVNQSNYSKMTATMMRNKVLIDNNIAISINLSEIALISINLLELMHPINWRFDLRTNRFFTKNTQYQDTLDSSSLEQLRLQLKNKVVSESSDKLLEKKNRDKKLLYCSEYESELLKKKISRDINEILIQLKLEYNLKELLITNLMFSWEKKSLEAFKVVHKGEVRDITSLAIRNLHLANGVSSAVTDRLIDLLSNEGLIKP